MFIGAREVQPTRGEGAIDVLSRWRLDRRTRAAQAKRAAWNIDVAWLTGQVQLSAAQVHQADEPARASRQRGYTLIEVIVAFAILALGLTLLLGTLSGAARQVRWADEAGRASLHAQSLLDTIGVGEALQPGRRDGKFEDGRYRWTLDVTPYRDPLLPPHRGDHDLGAPRLLAVVAAGAVGRGRRSAPAPAAAVAAPGDAEPRVDGARCHDCLVAMQPQSTASP